MYIKSLVDVMNEIPQIVPVFNSASDEANGLFYQNLIQSKLKKILPESLLENRENFIENLGEMLPFVVVNPNIVYCDEVPCQISFYVLAHYRPNAFKFFYEMVSRWLVPGKRLHVGFLQVSDFRFGQCRDLYTLSEIIVKVETQDELDQIQHNLPIIETELLLGIGSSYYARRILEIKGVTADEKTVEIYENIAHLIKRFPKDFEQDLLTEMQHVFTICSDAFKNARSSRHLSRIILYHYLFHKKIRHAKKNEPDKRHLFAKLFKKKLYFSKQRVIGIAVGVNFLRDTEVFDEKHVLKAIQNYIPRAKFVVGSYFTNRLGTEDLIAIYLEVEKEDQSNWTCAEVDLLQRQLPKDLKDCIEPLMYPVFMPCNEEEIMRNILSLSHQIKFIRDLPQLMISFDQQSHTDLFFTVICVRVLKPGTLTIQQQFERSGTKMEYIHDRLKTVGFLRKKYVKEATVFRVKLQKGHFLRKDHSIDLHKARQSVVSELFHIMGEIRDFNGGMISKQNEVLSGLKKILEEDDVIDELLLENFFYSLTPVIMRSLIEPSALKALYLMQQETLDSFKNGSEMINFCVEPHYVLAMVGTENREMKDVIARLLNQFSIGSSQLASSFIHLQGVYCLGYLYRCDDPYIQKEFCQTLQLCVNRSCSSKS